MVDFAFIFLAVILLSPILLTLAFDLVIMRLRPPLHPRRGFEVIPPVNKR